jgi:hypothetical protein
MTVSLGFLSVRQHPEHGYFGGYLITNALARPLEFHCTMPVKPSRAQELLYGPTMDAFVCGEQIAKALVTKAKVKPELVVTDCLAVLALTCVSEVAVAHLQIPARDEPTSFRIPAGVAGEVGSVTVAQWQFSIQLGHTQSQRALEQCLSQLKSPFDLTEPFQRITEALLEAHPIARAA